MFRNYKRLSLLLLLFFILELFSYFPIISAANNVSSCQPIFLSGEYVLMNDINYGGDLIDCILVLVDDVVFDCNGFSLSGENIVNGIVLNYTSNVTVKNCLVEGVDYGILVREGSGNTIIYNNLSSNVYGVRIQNSSNNVLTGNLINDNQESGIILVSSSENQIYNNFFININNFQITGVYGLDFWNNSAWGNYWAHPNNTGYSFSCSDLDSNYVCDTNYSLKINDTDFFPLKNCSICPIYTLDIDVNRGSSSRSQKNLVYSANTLQLSTGYTNIYSNGDSLNISLNQERHIMTLDKIKSDFVEINVSSVLQQATLFIGDTKKFSFTPNWYNISVILNKINGYGDSAKANITIMSINEPIEIKQEILSEVNNCIENWECDEWGECLNEKQTRNCLDLNSCETEKDKPLIEQSCEKARRWFLEIIYFIVILSIILLIVFLIKWGRLK